MRKEEEEGEGEAAAPRRDGGGRGPVQPQGGPGRLPQVRDGAAGGAAGALPERLAGAHPVSARQRAGGLWAEGCSDRAGSDGFTLKWVWGSLFTPQMLFGFSFHPSHAFYLLFSPLRYFLSSLFTPQGVFAFSFHSSDAFCHLFSPLRRHFGLSFSPPGTFWLLFPPLRCFLALLFPPQMFFAFSFHP